MDYQPIGYSSGWSIEEDPQGRFRWAAHGPAGVLRGQANTRAEAEQAAQQAEQELAATPGTPGTPRVRLPLPEQLLARAVAWAGQRPDIRGLALVGAWPAGDARADAEVDLVVLTSHPDRYLDHDWTAALGATRVLGRQTGGQLRQRRLLLEGDLELEVGLVEPAWAATDPVDPQTRQVVSHGLRILHDPDGRLAALALAATEAEP
jgi:hypothetical protein